VCKTLKSDPRQPPQTTTHAADRHGSRQCGWSTAVGGVGGRPAGGVGNDTDTDEEN